MRTLLPRGEEGRVEGVAAELGRGAPFGSEPARALRPDAPATPPSPTLPPSRGKGVYERVTYTNRAAGQAKRLRREMNVSERKLWEELRKLKLNIRRQAPIGRYIVDFVHHGSKLIIEVDGRRHDLPEEQVRDIDRDGWLNQQGYRVLRIRGDDAFGRPHDTAELIAAEIAKGRA